MMASIIMVALRLFVVVCVAPLGVGAYRASHSFVKRPLGVRRPLVARLEAMASPAIAQARIKTHQEAIRRLEKELAGLRLLVLEDEKAIQVYDGVPGRTYVDTTQRSIVKAFGWRVTAGIITFATSMYFTSNVKLALSIVASDFLSKSGTMFIGERVFNKVKAGRGSGGDSMKRSLIKALVWRAIAFVNTATVSGFLSGSAGVASKIASADAIFKTALMVFYDQCWNRIDWGKELENVDGDGI